MKYLISYLKSIFSEGSNISIKIKFFIGYDKSVNINIDNEDFSKKK